MKRLFVTIALAVMASLQGIAQDFRMEWPKINAGIVLPMAPAELDENTKAMIAQYGIEVQPGTGIDLEQNTEKVFEFKGAGIETGLIYATDYEYVRKQSIDQFLYLAADKAMGFDTYTTHKLQIPNASEAKYILGDGMTGNRKALFAVYINDNTKTAICQVLEWEPEGQTKALDIVKRFYFK
ncbi:MAG: hypothetical protein MJZ61_03375 [Bacteroidales bacterium]|nr:hypothetical protein [Bacteroidales bacterium]